MALAFSLQAEISTTMSNNAFMKNIEYFWNAIYYILWKLKVYQGLYFHYFFNGDVKPCVPQKVWEKAVTNPDNVTEYYLQKKGGSCHWLAANILNVIAASFGFLLTGIVTGYIGRFTGTIVPTNGKNIVSFIPVVLCWLLSDRLIFHEDKYLEYFGRFDTKSTNWKWKWMGITLFVLVAGIASFLGSLLLACCIIKL